MKIFDSVFKIVVVRADASESESEAVMDGALEENGETIFHFLTSFFLLFHLIRIMLKHVHSLARGVLHVEIVYSLLRCCVKM